MTARALRLPRCLLAGLVACGGFGCARLAIGPGVNAAALHTTALVPWHAAPELPSRSQVQAGQLVIHADFPLAEQHRIVRDLEALRVDVSQTFDMPISDEPVQLYLFETPQKYDAFVARQFPSFPVRRAFFVSTDTTLAVFAAWQDRVAEDLRHETTHGYVHAVVPAVPLWLDEGIAEFFEVPRAEAGLHRGHVAHLAGRIIEGTWRPDLARMEALASAGELSKTTMPRRGAGSTGSCIPRRSGAVCSRTTSPRSAATRPRPRSRSPCGMRPARPPTSPPPCARTSSRWPPRASGDCPWTRPSMAMVFGTTAAKTPSPSGRGLG
jgi:hypothetical protein